MIGRGTRWVLLVAVLLAGCWVVYETLTRIAEIGPWVEASRWLLPVLSLALVVLTLGLAGVLIRNLVKLIVERKRGILGSKLRIKLVFFFLAFVLLPALVLFWGSAQVIKQTVEAIIRTPLEHLTQGGELVAQWTELFEQQSLRRAQALALELRQAGYLEPGRGADLARLLDERRAVERFHGLWVTTNDGPQAAAEATLPQPLREQLARMVAGLVADVLERGEPESRIAKLGGGLVAQAAVPLDRSRAVVLVQALPARIASHAATIDSAVRDYSQFRSRRRDMVRFYVTLLALILIAILFVATWIGFYIARRITDPIREVAAGAREISAGNLGVRVRTRVGDEMGMLVDAFNEMAAELQESREVIIRSTADLRHSNRALDERRRYIETLLANLSTAVISLDPQGRVTTANPAVQKILGVALPPEADARAELERHGLGVLGALLDERSTTQAASLRRDVELPDSAPTQHVSVYVSPLRGHADARLGTLVMVEDLSDLLRAQKALAWQEVARRIAHEIKNPLTPIQLAAQRLRKKFFGGASDLDQVLLESTAAIEHEVSGLKQLVDEFSRFARMPDVQPEPVEFAGVVESVLSLYRGLTDIEWRVDLDPRVGWVRVDPRQMRRALINLIDNAVAAVGGKGEVLVRARLGPGDGRLHIEIADSGPGIPPGDRDKMFVPYFSTKRRGTGLGLAIVHKVVTDHRGTIRVEDNTPHGARFVIDIPA
jgi:two-component system nitrogen regulation sensor histidine kinase NtrY